MSDFQKSKLILTAVYKNGDVLRQDHPTPARVKVVPIVGAEKFLELSLRLVVDAKEAEELLEGLIHGEVSLSIEQMLSAAERNS